MELKIDKGMIKSLKVIAIVLAILGFIYIALYLWGIIGGTIFYAVSNGSSVRTTDVTAESITVFNTSTAITELANDNIVTDSLAVYNGTTFEVIGINNFSVDYSAGNISAINNEYNNSVLSCNYSYTTTTVNRIDVSSDANTFLSETQDDFFNDLGQLRDAIGVAISLLTLVVILLLFGGIFKGTKGSKKGKGDMGY